MEAPSISAQVTATCLNVEASYIDSTTKSNHFERDFEGGHMEASKFDDSWTFMLHRQDKDPAKIRLSYHTTKDLSGNILTLPYILIGERGVNSRGQTDFVSWRIYDDVLDRNEIDTLRFSFGSKFDNNISHL